VVHFSTGLDIPNGKEGGSFLHVAGYEVLPGAR
jgi:hypothetical protein